MNHAKRMIDATKQIVANVNKLEPNRLVFEPKQLGKGWELTDNTTGETIAGTVAECYAEARIIGERAAFAHLAKQQSSNPVSDITGDEEPYQNVKW